MHAPGTEVKGIVLFCLSFILYTFFPSGFYAILSFIETVMIQARAGVCILCIHAKQRMKSGITLFFFFSEDVRVYDLSVGLRMPSNPLKV